MAYSEVTMRFDTPDKRKHEVLAIPKPLPQDIKLKAALRRNIPEYYSQGSMILSLDTLELFAARGYGSPIQKVSDVEIGGSAKNFPKPGVENKIYIATVDPKGIYVWKDADAAYHQVSNTNDEGDYCFDSDVVHFVEGDNGEKLIVALVDETKYDPEAQIYVPTGRKKTAAKEEMKPIQKGREDRLYINDETNELYRFDSTRIVDVDEQDGRQHDISNGFVQVGATAPALEREFRDYKQRNDAAVEAVTEQAKATKEELASYEQNISPRVNSLEIRTEDLDKTKASKKELSDVNADLLERLRQEQVDRQQVQVNLDNYAKEQAARDAKQDNALELHEQNNNTKFASLDEAIAKIKSDLYADIVYAIQPQLKQVPYGRLRSALDLPASIPVVVDDNTKVNLEINWAPAEYDPYKAVEEQELKGVFKIPKWMTNTRNEVPVCKVVVGEDPKRNGSWTVHRFILPIMATHIKGFSSQLGMALSNEDVFGEGYQMNGQEALSRRHFELRLIGATFQTQALELDEQSVLIKDDSINEDIDHSFLPAEYFKNGVTIPVRTMSPEEQTTAAAELVAAGFCSDNSHPYWNGAYSYDEATDTLRFHQMGQATALVYEARKVNDGYIPYPVADEQIK